MDKKNFLIGILQLEKVVICIIKEIHGCVGKIINAIAAENKLDI